MSRHGVVCAAACGLLACHFDPSGVPVGDGGMIADAGPDAPELLDAGPCPEPLMAALRIGGVTEPPPAGQPYVHVLVGDVVELSAAGSCTRTGTLRVIWQIAPVDGTRATARPDLESETITIYPTRPDDYVVTLTVSNGEATIERTVLGVVAHGWAQRDGLPGNQEIRDLAVGADTLWITHRDGAYGLPLDAAEGAFFALANRATGAPIGTNLGAAHFSAGEDYLWLGQDASRSSVWRVDVGGATAHVAEIDFSGPQALGTSARVLDLGPAAPGVMVGTDKGLTISDDGETSFSASHQLASGGVHAVTAGSGTRWAGGTRLLAVGNDAQHDVFGAADNKIRALAVDEGRGELWVGSDGNGVARVSSSVPVEVRAVYDTASGTLAANRIRALAVETTGPYAGDVWAATSAGVARYIRAHDAWLLMGTGHGLQMRTDVRAIAIDSERRVIYAGTKSGLVALGAPDSP